MEKSEMLKQVLGGLGSSKKDDRFPKPKSDEATIEIVGFKSAMLDKDEEDEEEENEMDLSNMPAQLADMIRHKMKRSQ